ncbi:hypothetical protein UFOVP1165_42 [uncultured Caudovirales phage]|uniref:Uncharacterized protein n=1 Tax=uncultured Caudovirales phage TaxID=2100421 RepID=A0A6J5QU53_9CAUD|nr:hypothetical protein UFOVP1165_42 [uncultured Caudovirales phage]
MKKLRVLLPGCPLEQALEARKAASEQMSQDLADMVDVATTMVDRRKVVAIDCAERRRAHG